MKTFRNLGLLFAAFLAAIEPTVSQAQTSNLAPTSWLVTVEGESKTRTIAIASTTPKSDDVIQLDATYGWTGGNMRPVQAQINQAASPRQLVLITPADTKIVATERPDGTFQGTFSLKDGRVKGVVISRLADDPQVAAKSVKSGILEEPGPDVPANCAAFSGGWGGEWPIQGYAVLWVTSVSPDCKAMVVYTRTTKPPANTRGLSEASIKSNTLNWPRPDGGTTTFELSNGVLKAEYRGPSGVNNATMQRIDATSSAQIDQDLQAAMASVPPGPNIPAECASYYGSWGGSWSWGQGEWFLRVAEVRLSGDSCVVRYSYAPTKGPIPAKEIAEIKHGSISFVCNRSTGGTCVFERRGDTIAASYTNPAGGSNSAVFRRVE